MEPTKEYCLMSSTASNISYSQITANADLHIAILVA
jgi:hypothetical protein